MRKPVRNLSCVLVGPLAVRDSPEWWRAGAGKRFRERLLASVIVEGLSRHIAELAGEIIGQIEGSRQTRETSMRSLSPPRGCARTRSIRWTCGISRRFARASLPLRTY